MGPAIGMVNVVLPWQPIELALIIPGNFHPGPKVHTYASEGVTLHVVAQWACAVVHAIVKLV